MVKQIIQQVVERSPCQFQQLETPSQEFAFYKAAHLSYQRFLVILEADQLSTPSELNEYIKSNTPESLLETPAFAKNTDLVVLFKLNSLTELHQYEHKIFDIEENAYSLKKHILYYTETELEKLKHYLDSGKNIETLVTESESFNHYKKDPFKESAFSLACRLYVKFPFLSVPAKEATLTNANQLADQYLREQSLWEFYDSIELKLNIGNGYQEVMEALINEQMAD
ncbi:ABC-three component system middle component 1 [Aliivibrio fischeri]|uniref:ABC-three component system middle component 1 n=1 Tax=Aliivibrio fischeri TaxID=668 RepID=UPI0007C51333|nr:ABC-three component system middle component 1 [Aliivibrio fischeri]